MSDAILSRLLQRKKTTAACAAAVLDSRHSVDPCPEPLLKKYIRHKFLLEDEDSDSGNLQGLAKRSLMRAAGEAASSRYLNAKDCTGATNALTKIILLIMNIEQTFGVHFTPAESADAETVADLCRLVRTAWNREETRV